MDTCPRKVPCKPAFPRPPAWPHDLRPFAFLTAVYAADNTPAAEKPTAPGLGDPGQLRESRSKRAA